MASLSGRDDRAGRLWVTGASLGAGLSGAGIVAAHTSDATEVDGGLVIEVRGKHQRLVPVRQVWADTVREAVATAETIETVEEGRFVAASGRCAIYDLVGRLAPVNGDALSLRRARSTWLTAHLMAGTPLGVLRVIAGPVSVNTLNVLLDGAAEGLDCETACRRGFDA